jgi:uncharacterized protein (DUF433 family)
MSPLSDTFINSAEASFIAGVTDRDFNRAIDEQILPEMLVQLDPRRRVPRLASAFVSFYFKTEPLFSAQLRKKILVTVTDRIQRAKESESIWSLSANSSITSRPASSFFFISWKEPTTLTLDISNFVEDAWQRARLVDNALRHISVDEAVLGGTPVFTGTRVPIDSVLASLDGGMEMARLQQSYHFLTPELIDAARTYFKVRPKRGRPRRLSEVHPTWRLTDSKVVAPGA